MPVKAPELDVNRSGWVIGDAPIRFDLMKDAPEGMDKTYYFPWEYEIVFTGEDSAYTGITNDTKAIKDLTGKLIGTDALLKQQVFILFAEQKGELASGDEREGGKEWEIFEHV